LSFGLFVYSLVEGALTDVAVLDERVADWLVNKSKGKHKVSISKVRLLSACKLNACMKLSHDSASFNLTEFEDDLTKIKGGVSTLDLDGEGCYSDVLVVHEGVFDLLQKEKNMNWDPDEHVSRLLAKASFVVRTSGRGRETRHLHDSISFVEFNEVSGNVYQELNKPRLVKALLGSSGKLGGVK
ncbi:MAG: hypothetical protein D6732_19885, partial [Methanobacteriota archaeon]